MPGAVTSDDPRRSLADDPHFLASLSDLDRGVEGEPSESSTGPDAPRAQTASIRSPRPAQTPRRLNDLFPSTPGETAAFDTLPMPQPVTSGTRRLIPILDAVPESRPAVHPPEEAPSSAPRSSAPRSNERRSSERRSSRPAAYEAFYGLNEAPFTLAPDPRFLYHCDSYDRVAQHVLDAIRRRDGIAVLTGDTGVGKTTLCRVVMEQLDRRTLTSFVANPSVTPEALIRNVLVDFGVASTADVRTGRLSKASRDDLKSGLRDFLYSLAPLQAFAVIIIDEAQSLSEELLKEIGALADTGGEEQLLQILVVGEPPLLRTLSRSSLRSTFGRVSVRAALGSLAADEVGGYIAHRLQVAGASPRLEFQAAAIERLHELSGGNPRTINRIADRALSRGHARSAKTIGANIVQAAAEELDLVPTAPPSMLRRMTTAALFLMLVLVGAAAGAFVFRTEVAAFIRQWQAEPTAPAPPRPDLPAAYQLPPSPAVVQER